MCTAVFNMVKLFTCAPFPHARLSSTMKTVSEEITASAVVYEEVEITGSVQVSAGRRETLNDLSKPWKTSDLVSLAFPYSNYLACLIKNSRDCNPDYNHPGRLVNCTIQYR